jgi:hypothetical protein
MARRACQWDKDIGNCSKLELVSCGPVGVQLNYGSLERHQRFEPDPPLPRAIHPNNPRRSPWRGFRFGGSASEPRTSDGRAISIVTHVEGVTTRRSQPLRGRLIRIERTCVAQVGMSSAPRVPLFLHSPRAPTEAFVHGRALRARARLFSAGELRAMRLQKPPLTGSYERGACIWMSL